MKIAEIIFHAAPFAFWFLCIAFAAVALWVALRNGRSA
jgi:hypothetical protein